jgi:LPS-assembly protein
MRMGFVRLFPVVLFVHGSVLAQELLPGLELPPPVDTIRPVPAPEIPMGIARQTLPEPPDTIRIENFGKGPITGSAEEGVRYEGPGVKVSGDNGLEMFADSLVWDLREKTVTLAGNVSVYQGDMLQRGDRAVYYYETETLDASGMRASVDPFLLEAGKFTVETRGGKQVFVGHNAGVTTDDSQEPGYWIRARRTTITPDEKVVFEGLRLYAGDTPVFALPYLSQPLDAKLGYSFVPGARSNWGPFLLNTYGIMLGEAEDESGGEAWLLSQWHLDLRARRGVGVGVDLSDIRTATESFPGLSLYYLNDLDPSVSRSGIPRGFVNEDRYRVDLAHRIPFDLPDEASWRIESNLSWLSDRHFLEDFDTRSYRSDPQPDNTIGLYRRDDFSLLSVLGRFDVNDFYRADTRSPEIAFDQARRPLFGGPLLHEGATSAGLIGEKAPDFIGSAVVDPLMGMSAGDPAARRLLDQLGGYERRLAESLLALPAGDPRREEIRTQLLDPSYTRLHTYQQLSLPFRLGAVNLAPQAGFGYSTYGSIDGPQDDLDRSHLHGGIEASLKLSKDLGAVTKPRWGIDGLLHVVQPYAMWSLVSTDDFELGDPAVDRLTPTTRPRPLDPVRFTAIDQMETWNVVRLGTRNRLLTRRDGQSHEWLFLDTYADAFLDDPEGERDLSNLYNDIRWQPLPWLGVDLQTQFPIAAGGSGFTEFGTRVHFMPTADFDFSIGHRLLDGHPVLLDSNRFDIRTYTRLSEHWGIGTVHMVELDDGTLEGQQYTFHRDLGTWVAGVGLSMNDNRIEEEYGIVFSLTLKDFPSVSLPFEIDTQ